MSSYFPPVFEQSSFHCPHCGVNAAMIWSTSINIYHSNGQGIYQIPGLRIVKCSHCHETAIWNNGLMIYPLMGNVAIPNGDMPADVLSVYNEARNIINLSPRGATALLRLGLQLLMKHIGEKGENINADIKSLVQRGLSPQVQQALDSIRVIGNNAVHPGQIDINDNPEMATKLFGLLNYLCDHFITQPRTISELFGSLPEGDLNSISKRDS